MRYAIEITGEGTRDQLEESLKNILIDIQVEGNLDGYGSDDNICQMSIKEVILESNSKANSMNWDEVD